MSSFKKAFTLIELLLVMAITSALVYPLGTLFYSMQNNILMKKQRYQLFSDVDLALERISSYLSKLDARDLVIAAPQHLAFKTPQLITISVAKAHNSKDLALVLEADGLKESMLDAVTSFNLTYFNASGVVTTKISETTMVAIELTVTDQRISVQRTRLIGLGW